MPWNSAAASSSGGAHASQTNPHAVAAFSPGTSK